MYKKVLFGAVLVIAVGLVASERLHNHLQGAQEPAKGDAGKDLFEQLKKELDAKKDTLPPPLPTSKDDVLIPPPTVSLPKPAEATLPQPPTKDITPPKLDIPPSLPTTQKDDGKKGLEKEPLIPLPAAQPEKDKPLPTFEPKPQPKDSTPLQLPPVVNTPRVSQDPPTVQVPTQPALPANSPWTLHVEMVAGQTIVMATVNKKHEFKIVCQNLDLQTGKTYLKAMGKVTITGDALNGSCERLAISLMEDRLLLEGGAEVRIEKGHTNVHDARPAMFELKGENLNLRISELHIDRAHDWKRVESSSPLVRAQADVRSDAPPTILPAVSNRICRAKSPSTFEQGS